jgi:hypothetical protein
MHFTTPQTLAREAGQQQVAVDSHGQATVVWAAAGPGGTTLVQAVRLPATGLPGPTQTLATIPAGAPQLCPCPEVAIDPLGRATVVWQTWDEAAAHRRIQVVQWSSDGALGPVRTLSGATFDSWHQDLAVDQAGRATVAWLGDGDAVESVRLGPDGLPEVVRTLSGPGAAGHPEVALDPIGRATVTWSSSEGVQARRLDDAGVPGPLRTVSPPGEAAAAPQVVVDSHGRATIAWWRGSGAYEIKSVRLGEDGVPGPVQTLSPADMNVLEPDLAIDSLGRVTVAWEDFSQRVHALRLDENGAPGPVLNLSGDSRLAGQPQVAAAPDGRVVVVWAHPETAHIPPEGADCSETDFGSDSDVVQAAFIEPSGGLEGVREVSAHGEQSLRAQVALSPLGIPVVVWQSYDGTYFCGSASARVQASQGSTAGDPAAPSGPAAPTPPAAPATPSPPVLRLSDRAVVKDRHLVLGVVCLSGDGATCRGKLRLSVAVRHRPLLFARGGYDLASGRRGRISLPLSRAGRQLLARRAGRLIRAAAAGRGVERDFVLVKTRGSPFRG